MTLDNNKISEVMDVMKKHGWENNGDEEFERIMGIRKNGISFQVDFRNEYYYYHMNYDNLPIAQGGRVYIVNEIGEYQQSEIPYTIFLDIIENFERGFKKHNQFMTTVLTCCESAVHSINVV